MSETVNAQRAETDQLFLAKQGDVAFFSAAPPIRPCRRYDRTADATASAVRQSKYAELRQNDPCLCVKRLIAEMREGAVPVHHWEESEGKYKMNLAAVFA